MTKLLDLPDIVSDGVSDVLAEDQIVHVPLAAVELAHSLEHRHDSTFVAEVPDWDLQDWDQPQGNNDEHHLP